MKKILIALLILGVVVLSGCTKSTASTGGSAGVVITSFVADPTVIQGGEEVYLLMDIQNKGGTKANSIEANIIGLPTGGSTGWIVQQTSPPPAELLPPEKGMEGESTTVEWTLKSPESQTDIDYPLEGAVKYRYDNQKTETLVRLGNRDWLRSLPTDQRDQETQKQGQVSSSSQTGPISATIKAAASGSRLILDIQNTGGGVAENDKIIISVEGMTCSGLTGEVTLIRGKSKQLRCDPLGEPTQKEQWKNIRIDVTMGYNYIVKSPLVIKVERTPVV